MFQPLQLAKIYEDRFVSEEEALLKIELQVLFDKNFDRMNEYVKSQTASLIKQGVDPAGPDVFFTYNEYSRIRNS